MRKPQARDESREKVFREIQHLVAQGLRDADIGTRLGLTKFRVKDLRRSAGISPAKPLVRPLFAAQRSLGGLNDDDRPILDDGRFSKAIGSMHF